MKIVKCITGEFCTNTYVIIEGGTAIIVDPGAEYERIAETVAENRAAAEFVLVTHAHFDHVSAVAEFQKRGAKVYISRIDYDLLASNGFYVDLGFYGQAVEPFTADVKLSDGDEFCLIDHNFKTLATPGHTPGGVCFIMDGKTIFTGDTLFKNSVGRTDFKFGDGSALKNSIKRLFALNGDYEVLPGHNEASTLDHERKFNRYAKF